LPLLGTVPIELEIRAGGDAGVPLMISAPDSEAGRIFQTIVQSIVANVG
jgi:ATP-binding protein involved in chromosome partitioning